MKPMKKLQPAAPFRLIISVILGMFLLVSCASQSVKSSWTNKDLGAVGIEDVLVVGISGDLTLRRIFETSFVENLQKRGINAIPSYSIEPKPIEPKKEALLKVVEKANAKIVLMTRLIHSKEKTVVQQSVGQYSEDYNESIGTAFMAANEPVSAVVKTTKSLETGIYEVKSEKLVWKAVTESVNPEITRKYMNKLTGLLMSRLESDKLL